MTDSNFTNNRCACRVLHLVVRRGEMAVKSVSVVIDNVAKTVEHFRRSAIDRQDFTECLEHFGLPKHQQAQANSMYKYDQLISQTEAGSGRLCKSPRQLR
jgi:hypothetical protein